MEKDDDIKGSGNSYDFGARMYDSRLGRWLSVDKRNAEYAPITPYGFAINSPISLKDGDGNVVVDGNGNEVTISLSLGKNGEINANFGFKDGTSKEVVADFMKNGGRVVQAMVKTETGRDQALKAVITSDNVHYTVSQKEKVTEGVNAEGQSTIGTEFGVTNARAILIRDENGVPIGASNNTNKVQMEVIIWEGTIDYSEDHNLQNSTQKSFDENNLTKEQKIASVAGHETEHATNPVDRTYLVKGQSIPANAKEHKPANDAGKKIAKEGGDQNREKEK